MSRRVGFVLLGFGVVAATFIGRSYTALNPGARDAQLFAYIGDLWRQGVIPYRDVWDNKPPGIFAVVGLTFSFLPRSFTSLAVVEGVFIVGCIVSVYALVRRLRAARSAAVVAAMTAAVACNLRFYNQGGTLTEIYLLWPAVLSIYCAVRGLYPARFPWLFAAGCFAGVASLFKPVGLVPALAVGAFVVLFGRPMLKLSTTRIAGMLVVLATGAAAAWVPAAAYFAAHGALAELFDASFFYNISYGSASRHHDLAELLTILTNLVPLAPLLVATVAGTAVFLRRLLVHPVPEASHDVPPVWAWPLVLLWVLGDLGGALAGGRHYEHYYLPMAASLSVAVGLLVAQVREEVGEERSRVTVAVLAALIIGPIAMRLVVELSDLTPGHGKWPWSTLAERIELHRRPSDTLFIWAYWPGIYFQTGMRSPVHQLFGHHLGDFPAASARFGKEILADLHRSPPTFVVDEVRLAAESHPIDPYYARFRAMLDRDYEVVDRVMYLVLYRRRLPTRHVPPG